MPQTQRNRDIHVRNMSPSSPDRSRLVPLALDYTRLSRPKPNQEPVRRLVCEAII